jgi:hypothetical protein
LFHSLVPFIRAETIVDIEDIIALLVIVAVVVGRLARLGEDTSGIERQLISKTGVDEVVGGRQVRCQCLQRLL